MNRHVPYQPLFDRAKSLANWQDIVIWSSAVIAIGSIVVGNLKMLKDYSNTDNLLLAFNVLSTLLAVVFIVLEIVINFSFYKSTREKHLDLFDHAFDEDFSADRSSGYYNSGNIPPGVYKLAVLTFENSLFTSVIAKIMTRRKWTVVIIISIFLLASAAVGNSLVFNGLAQLALTGAIIIQAVRLQLFANQMAGIHEDFKFTFNLIKDQPRSSDEAGKLLRLPLSYISTLTWGCILLSQRVFDKKNPDLSIKWEKMKVTYKIQ